MKLVIVITIVVTSQGISADAKVSDDQVTEEILAKQIRDLRDTVKNIEQDMLDLFEPCDRSSAMAKTEIRQLREHMEKLEEFMLTFLEPCGQTTTGGVSSCCDGFIYQCKCYFFTPIGGTAFSKAEDACRTGGGTVGDLLNGEHQKLLDDYVQKMVPESDFDIRLGNTYDPKEDVIYYSDGDAVTQVTKDSFSWSGSRNDGFTELYILFHPNSSRLINGYPGISKSSTLCVK